MCTMGGNLLQRRPYQHVLEELREEVHSSDGGNEVDFAFNEQ